jgi:hypothetical protein
LCRITAPSREREGVDPVDALGSVEPERVGSGVAVDEVVAVPRVPDELVGAGPEDRGVVTGSTGDLVVPVAAGDGVRARAARQIVVPDAAVESVVPRAAGQLVDAGIAQEIALRHRAVALVEREGVVSVPAVQVDEDDVVHRRGPTEHGGSVQGDGACRRTAHHEAVVAHVAHDRKGALVERDGRDGRGGVSRCGEQHGAAQCGRRGERCRPARSPRSSGRGTGGWNGS